MSDYLTREEITQLAEVAARNGMGETEVRELLFAFVSLDYYTRLPVKSNPRDQVQSDLIQMNRIPFLRSHEVPLLYWLEQAVQRLQSGSFADLRLFEKAHEKVALESQCRIAADQGQPETSSSVTGELERVVGRNDLLAFGWLSGALAVGTSVARLIVPRYHGGSPVYFSSGNPKEVFGTGWLIGSQYVMTNYHVINGRTINEGHATEQDLHLQARHTTVQFDYDEDNITGVPAAVAELVAWNRYGDPPQLDFALLKLTEPVDRTPLMLAPGAIGTIDDDPVAVNIIQHPGGNAKKLGIRNNLAHKIDDFELSYFTDTQGGSSGSPVCDDRWRVVALHKMWNPLINENVMFQGQSVAWENRGTRIGRIIAELQTNYPDAWHDIGATVVPHD